MPELKSAVGEASGESERLDMAEQAMKVMRLRNDRGVGVQVCVWPVCLGAV